MASSLTGLLSTVLFIRAASAPPQKEVLGIIVTASFTGRMTFLSPRQQCQVKGTRSLTNSACKILGPDAASGKEAEQMKITPRERNSASAINIQMSP